MRLCKWSGALFCLVRPDKCLLPSVEAPFRGTMRTSDRPVRIRKLDLMSEIGGQGQNRTADTRIFSRSVVENQLYNNSLAALLVVCNNLCNEESFN